MVIFKFEYTVGGQIIILKWFRSSKFILFKLFKKSSILAFDFIKKKKKVVIESNNPFGLAWELARPKPDRKKEICKDKIITNKRDLIENIFKAWHNTPALQKIAKKCIASMPQRIQNVIALEREDSLNIEIVLLNLYCPMLIRPISIIDQDL